MSELQTGMKVGWGLIGCGQVAENKGGPALYQVVGTELVAVMSRSQEKAALFASRHQARRYYTKLEEILADREVTAVYLATPLFLHATQTIQAARAGKHVLVEKPMAINTAQARMMTRECQQAGVKLAVAYYRRFFPKILRIKQWLAAGKIGQPLLARVTFLCEPSALTLSGAHWRARSEMSGGGILPDLGSHRLDLLLYLLGEADQVAAFLENRQTPAGIDDTCLLSVSFRSGASGQVFLSQNASVFCDEFKIYGTQGIIEATPLDSPQLRFFRGGSLIEECHLPRPSITHLGLVEDFVRSILTGKEPLVSGEEGIKTTQLIDAAYLSAQEGRIVSIAGQREQSF